jgi:hypothetical protein
VIVSLAICGCDQRPTASSEDASDSTAEADAASQVSAPGARPTTQELLSGEHVRVGLRVIPFTIEAPKGWQLKSHGGVLVLEGPTPAGTAQIQIGKYLPPIAQHAERLIDGAKKEVASAPGPHNMVDVRKIGDVQVLEYRLVGQTRASPAIDGAGKKIADTSTPMQWKLSAFVTSGKETEICQVSMLDLTREQYEIDKELLQRIIASLKYDPSAAGG